MSEQAVSVARRDPYSPYRRTLLPPGRVRELSRLRPLRMAADTALCWALIIGAWLGAAAIGTWWAAMLAGILVGNRWYALWIVGHDGLHRRLVQDSNRSDLVADLFMFGPIGAITHINNRNHLLHHQNLANDDDPDRHRHGCFNKATKLALVGYSTAVTTVILSVANVFKHGPRSETVRSDPARPRYRARDIVIIVGWQAVLLVVLTRLFGWWGWIGMWWIPVFLFGFLADNMRSFLEHSVTEADSEADAHRLVTHHPSWLERQLLSPMNMNYHAAHHLWTSIPYYNLPQADAEMRQADNTGALLWRRSYLAYLWQYSRALPIEGCGPAVQHG